MAGEPIGEFVFSPHAVFEMARRGIDAGMVAGVLGAPEQRLIDRPGRVVLQSRIASSAPGRVHLLRVVVDVHRVPAEVVTVYRTSKVQKYWRDDI